MKNNESMFAGRGGESLLEMITQANEIKRKLDRLELALTNEVKPLLESHGE